MTIVMPLLVSGSPLEEELRQALRWSGRISFLLFLVPLTAQPLRILHPSRWSSWLVERRGNFGLAMVGNQIAHLLLIIALYDVSEGPPVSVTVFWGGVFGFIYLSLMATLTFEVPVRFVGPRITKFVHRWTLYYMTFLFMYDFMLKNPFGTYPLLTAIWFSAVGLRLVAWVVEAKQSSSTATLPIREAARGPEAMSR